MFTAVIFQQNHLEKKKKKSQFIFQHKLSRADKVPQICSGFVLGMLWCFLLGEAEIISQGWIKELLILLENEHFQIPALPVSEADLTESLCSLAPLPAQHTQRKCCQTADGALF